MLSEADIQRQILDHLAIRRVFHYRNNTGAMSGSHKGKAWFMRFGRPGAPDIVAVVDGRYIGIEVKKVGNDQSRAQKEFEVALNHAGGLYVLARCLEDVLAVIA